MKYLILLVSLITVISGQGGPGGPAGGPAPPQRGGAAPGGNPAPGAAQPSGGNTNNAAASQSEVPRTGREWECRIDHWDNNEQKVVGSEEKQRCHEDDMCYQGPLISYPLNGPWLQKYMCGPKPCLMQPNEGANITNACRGEDTCTHGPIDIKVDNVDYKAWYCVRQRRTEPTWVPQICSVNSSRDGYMALHACQGGEICSRGPVYFWEDTLQYRAFLCTKTPKMNQQRPPMSFEETRLRNMEESLRELADYFVMSGVVMYGGPEMAPQDMIQGIMELLRELRGHIEYMAMQTMEAALSAEPGRNPQVQLTEAARDVFDKVHGHLGSLKTAVQTKVTGDQYQKAMASINEAMENFNSLYNEVSGQRERRDRANVEDIIMSLHRGISEVMAFVNSDDYKSEEARMEFIRVHQYFTDLQDYMRERPNNRARDQIRVMSEYMQTLWNAMTGGPVLPGTNARDLVQLIGNALREVEQTIESSSSEQSGDILYEMEEYLMQLMQYANNGNLGSNSARLARDNVRDMMLELRERVGNNQNAMRAVEDAMRYAEILGRVMRSVSPDTQPRDVLTEIRRAFAEDMGNSRPEPASLSTTPSDVLRELRANRARMDVGQISPNTRPADVLTELQNNRADDDGTPRPPRAPSSTTPVDVLRFIREHMADQVSSSTRPVDVLTDLQSFRSFSLGLPLPPRAPEDTQPADVLREIRRYREMDKGISAEPVTGNIGPHNVLTEILNNRADDLGTPRPNPVEPNSMDPRDVLRQIRLDRAREVPQDVQPADVLNELRFYNALHQGQSRIQPASRDTRPADVLREIRSIRAQGESDRAEPVPADVRPADVLNEIRSNRAQDMGLPRPPRAPQNTGPSYVLQELLKNRALDMIHNINQALSNVQQNTGMRSSRSGQIGQENQPGNENPPPRPGQGQNQGDGPSQNNGENNQDFSGMFAELQRQIQDLAREVRGQGNQGGRPAPGGGDVQPRDVLSEIRNMRADLLGLPRPPRAPASTTPADVLREIRSIRASVSGGLPTPVSENTRPSDVLTELRNIGADMEGRPRPPRAPDSTQPEDVIREIRDIGISRIMGMAQGNQGNRNGDVRPSDVLSEIRNQRAEMMGLPRPRPAPEGTTPVDVLREIRQIRAEDTGTIARPVAPDTQPVDVLNELRNMRADDEGRPRPAPAPRDTQPGDVLRELQQYGLSMVARNSNNNNNNSCN